MLPNLKTYLVFAADLVLAAAVVNVVIFVVLDLAVSFENPRRIVPKVDFVIECCRITRESRWNTVG